MKQQDIIKQARGGNLEESCLIKLTDKIAQQHITTPLAADIVSSKYIADSVHESLSKLENLSNIFDENLLSALQHAFSQELVKNDSLFTIRCQGYVKESPDDNSLDTIADLATLLVELKLCNRKDLAILALNRYLKRTDDFQGLLLINFYEALQAINCSYDYYTQSKTAKNEKQQESYLQYARQCAEMALYAMQQQTGKRIVVIGGLSGSGKTTLGRSLSSKTNAIHIRSDAVRKHLMGVNVSEKAPLSAYDSEHSKKTYTGLEDRASMALSAGFDVIVDAIFANEDDRDNIESFGHLEKLSFTGVWCSVPADVARKRIVERHSAQGLDALNKKLSALGLDGYEKQLLLDPGRITWHRLDALYGVEQLVARVLSFMELSEED